eukprot:jgi/Mesen1/3975/ME000210S03215
MKWRVAGKKIMNYMRYDFPEIVSPSSLPDPPEIWRAAFRSYAQSWSGHVDVLEHKDERQKAEKEKKDQEPTTFEDLAVAARLGADGVRPVLQRLYYARAAAYRDALRQFVVGYQEGVAQVKAEEAQEMMKEHVSSDLKKPESESTRRPPGDHK